MKKMIKQMALVIAAAVSVGSGTPVVPEVQAAEVSEAVQSDVQLQAAKSQIAQILAQAGVIAPENAAVIAAAPIETADTELIEVKYSDGEVIFLSSAGVMDALCAEHTKVKAAELYILQVARAVAEADMWLRLNGNINNVPDELRQGWKKCVEVSVLNLVLKNKLTRREAEQMLPGGMGAERLQKYVVWNDDKQVFCPVHAAWVADFGTQQADSTEAKKEVAETRSPEILPDHTPAKKEVSEAECCVANLVCAWILLCLFGGICVSAVYVLGKECKRRWKPLPLPKGETTQHAFRPEFDEYVNWAQMLEWKLKKDKNGNMSTDVGCCITNRKTVDKGYEVLHKLAILPGLSADEIDVLNKMGRDLNEAQKRSLQSSKWLLSLYVLGYLLLIAMLMIGDYACGGRVGVLGISTCVVMVISLFMADLQPAYQFSGKDALLTRCARRALKGIGAGTWAKALFVEPCQRYVTEEGSDAPNAEQESPMGRVAAVLVVTLMVVLFPVIVVGRSLLAFYRHYVCK